MADAGWSLQVAIYEALNGNLTGVDGGAFSLAFGDAFAGVEGVPVYGAPKQGSATPYVSIDNATMAPDVPLARRRDIRTVNLSVWSNYRGNKEVLLVLGQIYDLLHQKRLPMAGGFRMVRARVSRQQSTRDADGVTYMGACTVEARVEG